MATTGHESEAINVQGLKASLQKLKTDHIDGKADEATTLAGYGITDAYTKTEVNGLVDTPHQNYVTVAATSQTAAATDVLPASGQAADTIYRVSNWDGSANSGAGAFDATCYSEYAWDDVSNPNKYVFLCVKSQIGEVFDISVYNNNAKYADLAAALNGGANIPQSLQKGGMSVKFVLSSDNKYVQYRLKSNTFSTDTEDWEDESTEVQFRVMVEALTYLYNENKALHELLTGKDNAVLPYIKAQTIECVDKMTMGVPDVLESNVAGAPSAANVPDNWNEETMTVWDGCPRKIGQQYVDKASGKVYYAIKVTGSTANWVALN